MILPLGVLNCHCNQNLRISHSKRFIRAVVKVCRGPNACHLTQVSLFPVREKIIEVARLLLVPGAVPENAGVDALHIGAAAVEEMRVSFNLELPSYRKRAYPEERGKDFG